MILPRTRAMFIALATLLVVDAGVHWNRDKEDAPMPTIPKVDVATVTHVTLHEGDTKIAFEKHGDAWQMTAPMTYPADPQEIAAILATVQDSVTMDVLVDHGNDKDYGLVSPDAVQVELAGDTAPITEFYVGHDADGGTTMVRFPDSDDVYRANVGGRARFDKPPDDWRDHAILTLEPAKIDEITIERSDGTIALSRVAGTLDDSGAPNLGPWRFDDEPAFPVDQPVAGDLASALAHLRAQSIWSADHPSGLDDPLATVTVRSTSGEPDVLLLGATSNGVFARKKGANEVYQIAPIMAQRLLLPKPRWRDRTLVSVDLAGLESVALVDETLKSVMTHDAAGAWHVTEPKNVDVDPRESALVAKGLTELRAQEIELVDAKKAGFPSTTRVVLTLADTSTRTLEFGELVPGRPQGQEQIYVRTADAPDRITALAATTVARIKRAFGR